MRFQRLAGIVRTVATRPAYQAAIVNGCAAGSLLLLSVWLMVRTANRCCYEVPIGSYYLMAAAVVTLVAAVALVKAVFDYASYGSRSGISRPLALTAGRIGGGLVLVAVPLAFVTPDLSVLVLVAGLVGSLAGAARVRR